MAKFAGKIMNDNGFRRVPGTKDIVAVKVQCDHETNCTGCHKPIHKGNAMWFCDRLYLKDGQDGRWHVDCL